jgi:toxin ParE1/3/4
MTYTIQFTAAAKADLQELKAYVVHTWSKGIWKTEAGKLKQLLTTLESMPYSGAIPSELAEIGITEFRQKLTNKNRLLYCIDESTQIVTVLLVCSQQRDLSSMLQRRLLMTGRQGIQ